MIQELEFKPAVAEFPIYDNELIDIYRNTIYNKDVEDLESFLNRIRNELFNPEYTESTTRVIKVKKPEKPNIPLTLESAPVVLLEEPQISTEILPTIKVEQKQTTTLKNTPTKTNPVKGKYRLGSESTGGRKAYIYYNNQSPYGYDFMYEGKPLLNWDIADLLKSRGFHKINNKSIVYGDPNRRTSNVGSPTSYHRSIDKVTKRAMARDIVISKGSHADYDTFRKKLMGDPIVLTWMNLKGWGIINEITPEIRAITKGTGNHFHFGPDQWAQRTWHLWQLNPSIPVTKKLQEGGIIKNRFTN